MDSLGTRSSFREKNNTYVTPRPPNTSFPTHGPQSTTARSLPPRPLRRHLGGSGISTNTPSRRNASRECASVAAVTDEAFPRVLNGPAPGYAEDALRTLMLGASADTQQARVPRRANGYRAARAAPDNDLSHNSNGSAESYRENEISQNLSTTTAWSEPESALDAYPANGGGEATARMEASRALDRWAALGEDEADGANDVAGLRAALFPRTDELSARGGAALAEDPPSDDRRQVSSMVGQESGRTKNWGLHSTGITGMVRLGMFSGKPLVPICTSMVFCAGVVPGLWTAPSTPALEGWAREGGGGCVQEIDCLA